MYNIMIINFSCDIVKHMDVGFKALGHNVLSINFNRYGFCNKTFKEDLIKNIEKFKPHFIFSYGWWSPYLDVSMYFNIIKGKGICHVYWAYDDPDCFENMSYPMSKSSDLVFTTLIEHIPIYRERGINTHLLMHSCNPYFHKKEDMNEKFKSDITLIANNYSIQNTNINFFNDRIWSIKNLIEPIVLSNYDFSVWGLWWDKYDRPYILPKKNYRGYISNKFEPKIYSSCKISIGLQSVLNSNTHMSVRVFQALGCQSFHISQYCKSLEQLFKKGVDMEWSSSKEETLELVKFYLKNDALREKIARKGQEVVYEKHTVINRAKEVLDKIRIIIK